MSPTAGADSGNPRGGDGPGITVSMPSTTLTAAGRLSIPPTVSGWNCSDCGTMSEGCSVSSGSRGGTAAPAPATAIAVGEAPVSSAAPARTADSSSVGVDGSRVSGSGVAGTGDVEMLGEGTPRVTGASGVTIPVDWRPVYHVNPASTAADIPAPIAHLRTARRLGERALGPPTAVAGSSLAAPVVDDAGATRTASDSRDEVATAPSIAAANDVAEGHRSSGAFARHFSTTFHRGSARRCPDGMGIGSLTCFMSTASGESALNGTCPVSISYATIPRL